MAFSLRDKARFDVSMKNTSGMISYCTNIYPAESWEDTFQALKTGVPSIRRHLEDLHSPVLHAPLGVGLRLSRIAADQLLASPGELDRFRSWLKDEHAVVQTLNGFPYGNFHGERIKENVFKPDWTTHERFEYTCKLVEILTRLSHDTSLPLSVSTLPGSHQWFRADEERIFARLEALCGVMDRLYRETGRLVTVGLEPEPMGHFDNTYGTIHFFQRMLNASRRPELIEKHLGVTYDTCHFAVMGENPGFTLPAWEENGISVVKIQFSNALELPVSSWEDLSVLAPFTEQVYFHQTTVMPPPPRDGSFLLDAAPLLFPDLPDALNWAEQHTNQLPGSIWRVHYHIPLGARPMFPLHNTESFNREVAEYMKSTSDFNPILEVETYTWTVLPASLKNDISRQIASELYAAESLFFE